MDPERTQLSITLPRNFMFHYHDLEPPRTPEPEPVAEPEDLQPPPPPRQTLKVRRRRATGTTACPAVVNVDAPVSVPTIHAPEPQPPTSWDPSVFPHPHSQRYLSPAAALPSLLSPPKTPVAQIMDFGCMGDELRHWSDVDQGSQSEASSRPTSSSGLSDSSISSRGSFGSFPSLAGSCTSPEEEPSDIFFSPEEKWLPVSSPLVTLRQSHPQRRYKLKAAFSEEMDHHLWMTYMKYLQDPTVTPFKALPSTVPPNGVCHRVARMARKTWKQPRAPTFLNQNQSACCNTPETVKPTSSGNSTPVPPLTRRMLRFPTEKQCRKRLRDLAKQKPFLSAHYQRLLNRRSPSPFESSPPESTTASSSHGLSSPFSEEGPSFSTRDMNISLAQSTATSMQIDNPLASLASRGPLYREQHASGSSRSSAHQKSQSLHIGLGLGSIVGSSIAATSNRLDTGAAQQHNAQTWHAPSSRPPPLGSPLRLHSPRPISPPFKRRALHNFEEQVRNRGNSFVDQLFGAPAESSHRRVRSRGFSLGDMMEGARRTAPTSSSGPVGLNPFAPLIPNVQASPNSEMGGISPAASHGQATVRLGSPFNGRPGNTFPRLSPTYGFASFEQRLAGYSSRQGQPDDT